MTSFFRDDIEEALAIANQRPSSVVVTESSLSQPEEAAEVFTEFNPVDFTENDELAIYEAGLCQDEEERKKREEVRRQDEETSIVWAGEAWTIVCPASQPTRLSSLLDINGPSACDAA